jgi:hypothetical protein
MKKLTRDKQIKRWFLSIPVLTCIAACIISGWMEELEWEHPAPPEPRTDMRYDYRPAVQTTKQPPRTVMQFQSEENKLIEEFSKEDYYDIVDYYGGLDGEFSDVDYNEIRDYFED